jgi:hypothetical protein
MLRAVTTLATMLAMSLVFPTNGAVGRLPSPTLFPHPQKLLVEPQRRAPSVALASNRLRIALTRLQAGHPADVHVIGDRPVDGQFLEALAPFQSLEVLEATKGVRYLRPPLRSHFRLSS